MTQQQEIPTVKSVRLGFLQQAGIGLANTTISMANNIAGEYLMNFTATVPKDCEAGKQLREAHETMRRNARDKVKSEEQKISSRYLEAGDFINFGIPEMENQFWRQYHDVCWDIAMRFELI